MMENIRQEGQRVKVDGVFEGPLDLLLHLVRKHELDVWNLSMGLVCREYLVYLESLEKIDVGETAVWLEMAATLVAIKAKMLVPVGPGETEEEDSGPDPREALARSLILRAVYKKAAALFGTLEIEWSNVYRRAIDERNSELSDDGFPPPPPNLSLEEIACVWVDLAGRFTAVKTVSEIAREEVRVSDRIELLLSLLDGINGESLEFDEFCSIPSPSLRVRVASFLALLELARLGRIAVRQDEAFGGISISRGGIEENLGSIFAPVDSK